MFHEEARRTRAVKKASNEDERIKRRGAASDIGRLMEPKPSVVADTASSSTQWARRSGLENRQVRLFKSLSDHRSWNIGNKSAAPLEVCTDYLKIILDKC